MPRFSRVPCVHLQQYLKGTVAERADFVDVLGSGLKEFGFVVVEGTNVGSDLIKQSYAKITELFSQPKETKEKYHIPGGGGQRGYTGFGKEHAKDSKVGDLKEFWHVGRETYQGKEKLYPANIWADAEVPGFQNCLLELYQKLDGLADSLLEATSLYLGLEPRLLPNMAVDGNSILRCIHYPPLQPEQAKSGAVRAAAHEDINLITILCEATESGLELLTRQGKWMSVESGPGQMVVDSGDMLSRVCNNQIPSTTHRVTNPPGARNVAHYSMPFFVHPYSKLSPNAAQLLFPQSIRPSRRVNFWTKGSRKLASKKPKSECDFS